MSIRSAKGKMGGLVTVRYLQVGTDYKTLHSYVPTSTFSIQRIIVALPSRILSTLTAYLFVSTYLHILRLR